MLFTLNGVTLVSPSLPHEIAAHMNARLGIVSVGTEANQWSISPKIFPRAAGIHVLAHCPE
jgi:hypothetical protein